MNKYTFPNEKANEIVIIYGFCLFLNVLFLTLCRLPPRLSTFILWIQHPTFHPFVCDFSLFHSSPFLSRLLSLIDLKYWRFEHFKPTQPFAKCTIKVRMPFINRRPELFFSFKNESFYKSSLDNVIATFVSYDRSRFKQIDIDSISTFDLRRIRIEMVNCFCFTSVERGLTLFRFTAEKISYLQLVIQWWPNITITNKWIDRKTQFDIRSKSFWPRNGAKKNIFSALHHVQLLLLLLLV